MKQLRKIQLKDAVVISDSEMRQIRGGIEGTTGASCDMNAEQTACANPGAACDVSTALKGKCTWTTGTTGKGGCSCKWTNPN